MGKRFWVISSFMATSLFAILCVAGSTYAANNASVGFYANVSSNTTLAVEIDSETAERVVMNLAPNPGTTAFQDSNDVDITVVSNNRTGYYLAMSTTSSNLTNTADDTLHISSLDATNTTGYTTSNFPANSWGYSVKTGNNYGNYFGIGDYVVLQNASAPAQSTSTVKFATKVDSTLPSGVYTTSILFTIIAKPSLYMQDVALWKDSVRTGESVQAIDNRDMKSYWVTRIETDPAIPDDRAECTGTGNDRVCTQLWMTQNLDLDLDSTRTYTHADTDLGWTDGDAGATWQPDVSTKNDLSTFGESWEDSYSDSAELFYYYPGGDVFRALTQSECEAMLGLNSADCYHYHAGNHYYEVAAIAGWALRGDGTYYLTNENIATPYYTNPNSVCPAGWKLPRGLTSENDYSDFDYLLYYNNVSAAHGNTYITKYVGQYYYPYVESVGYATHLHDNEEIATDGRYNNASYPLWFTHAGIVSYSQNDGNYFVYEPAERAGYLTSNTVFIENGSHMSNGDFDYNGLYHYHTCADCIAPADITEWGDTGWSVRCIAR